MADDNRNIDQNLGDQDSRKKIIASKELLDMSKQLLRDEGDYLNLLKDANKALLKSISSYENIESKLDSLNKGSINLKEINRELRKVELDRSILSKKILEFEKEQVNSSEDIKKNLSDYFKIQKESSEIEKKLLEKKNETIEAEKNLAKETAKYNNYAEINQTNLESQIQTKKLLEQAEKSIVEQSLIISQKEKEKEDIISRIQIIKGKERKDLINQLNLIDQTIAKEKQTETELVAISKLRSEELKGIESIIEADKAGIIAAQKQVDLAKQAQQVADVELSDKKSSLETAFANLDQEQKSYILNLQALGLTEEQLKFVLERLAAEKEVNRNLGVSGKLMGSLVKSLGLGSEVYEEMVETSRKLGKEFGFFSKLSFLAKASFKAISEAAKDPLTYVIGMGKAIKAVWDSTGKAISKGTEAIIGSGGAVTSFIQPISEFISKIPLIGGLAGATIDLFAKLVDFGIDATSEIQKFARSLGMSVQDATEVNAQMTNFAESSGKAFLNVKKMREEQMKLSDALGINQRINNNILADSIQLKEQFGLQEDAAAELAKVAIITGKGQVQILQTILKQTSALTKSTGVSARLQETIKQAASFGGVLGLTFTKYPEKLTRSLLVTKALGMDLQKLDSIASGLLDFESSISKEFESQLITGKDINLAKARELAMNNDLAGLAVEINKQVGSSEQFIKMNRFAQEAFSEAVGMSRDELADMLRKQELFAAAGAKDLKTYKERIAQMEKEGTLKDEFLSKLTAEQEQYFLSSTANERIANFIDRIRQNFATLIGSPGFQNLVDKVLTYLEDPNVIDNILNKVSSFFSYIVRIVATMLDGLNSLPFVEIDENLRSELHDYADALSSGTSIVKSLGIGNTEATDISSKKIKGSLASNTLESESMSLRKSGQTPTYSVTNDIKVDPLTGQGIVTTALQTVYADGSTGAFSKQTSGR